MTQELENKICYIFQWFMGIGAVALLAFFTHHTIGFFQSPEYFYSGTYLDANGNTIWATYMSEITVWDGIIKSGWWFPFFFCWKLVVSWYKWTFVLWYTNSILEMHLGLFTIPFWGYWIWMGLNWIRGDIGYGWDLIGLEEILDMDGT